MRSKPALKRLNPPEPKGIEPVAYRVISGCPEHLDRRQTAAAGCAVMQLDVVNHVQQVGLRVAARFERGDVTAVAANLGRPPFIVRGGNDPHRSVTREARQYSRRLLRHNQRYRRRAIHHGDSLRSACALQRRGTCIIERDTRLRIVISAADENAWPSLP
jgi:hypothetical protein